MIATAVMLFGLNVAPLLDAIAAVESDLGATSANVYQLRRIYVDDLRRIYGDRFCGLAWTYEAIANDQELSKQCVLAYWEHYGARYTATTGRRVTFAVLARIHNGGPRGWAKPSTLNYWNRVRRELNKHTTKGETK